eukprot:12462584-Heterocapsa_arctica.AAC.1
MDYANPAFLRMLLGMGDQIAIAAKQAAQVPPLGLAQDEQPRHVPREKASPIEKQRGTAALLRAKPKYTAVGSSEPTDLT